MNEAAQESTRRGRIAHQERSVGRAVSEFEAAKGRLLRRDGTRIYGEAEHAERVEALTEGLRGKVGAVAKEAEGHAEEYEREALALSYSDPAQAVPASERGRLEASRAFVKEDCEGLEASALTERLAAVSAGPDKVGQVLHARYARRRVEALEAEANAAAAEGRPMGPAVAAERRGLMEALSGLEGQLADPKKTERASALKEAASESRRVAREAKTRLSQADGSEAVARERARAQTAASF